jgi:DNA repair exonuclease SbcCD ATPase subunit
MHYRETNDKQPIEQLVTEITQKLSSYERQFGGLDIMLKTYEAQGDTKSTQSIKKQLDDMANDVEKLQYAQSRLQSALNPSPTSPSGKSDTFSKSEHLIKLKMKYDYIALDESQLTVKKGDILTLISEIPPNQDWVKASVNELSGYIPRSYVDILDRKAKILFDYEPIGNTEIKLQGN